METLLVLFNISPEFVTGRTLPLAHPQEGDERLVEAPDFGLQVLAELVGLLPIPSLDGVYVFRGRIVEVHGKVLAKRLGLDFGKNLRLFLGAVGLPGVFVFAPKVFEDVSVVSHGCGIEHADQSQHGGYQ